jgi:hypothetical protein
MYTENPSLVQLELFVGKWEMELSNASFLPDPKTVIKGVVTFERLEGAFLLMRIGSAKQPPNALWLISCDDTTREYKAFYFDDRKVSRIYDMSFNHKIWKIWRYTPKFSQRFEGKISKDDNTIKAYWEKLVDGKTWEHDFDIIYTRI